MPSKNLFLFVKICLMLSLVTMLQVQCKCKKLHARDTETSNDRTNADNGDHSPDSVNYESETEPKASVEHIEEQTKAAYDKKPFFVAAHRRSNFEDIEDFYLYIEEELQTSSANAPLTTELKTYLKELVFDINKELKELKEVIEVRFHPDNQVKLHYTHVNYFLVDLFVSKLERLKNKAANLLISKGEKLADYED